VTLRAGLAVGVGQRSCSWEAVSAVCVKGQAWRRVRLNNGWAESEARKCCVVRWMRNAGGRMGLAKAEAAAPTPAQGSTVPRFRSVSSRASPPWARRPGSGHLSSSGLRQSEVVVPGSGSAAPWP
jgi:hypothetical protein